MIKNAINALENAKTISKHSTMNNNLSLIRHFLFHFVANLE